MSAKTPDERIPQEPGIPVTPREPAETEVKEPDGSELPAEPEAPDEEGQRQLRKP